MSVRSLDEKLINEIQPYLISDYEELNYVRQPGLRKAFISDNATAVNLTYDRPSQIDYENVFNCLNHLYDQVHVAEAVVKRAYQPKLEEIKNKYSLLKATAEIDDDGVLEYSKAVYGLPKTEYYFYTLQELRTMLVNIESKNFLDHRVTSAVEKLKPILEKAHVSTDWNKFDFPAFETDENSTLMSAAEIKNACEEAFAQYQIEGWQAVISAPGVRMTFNTNQEERIVYIPDDSDTALRKYPLTNAKVRGLIAHEIGTHAVRRENGVKSPLALLGNGLAGYLPGEEGIATYYEQQASGATNFAGGLGYLSISWVVGLDGESRDFRGLFEIVYPYLFLSILDHLSQSSQSLDFNRIEENAKRNAWSRCIRTFRGTTGRTAGCCLTRDIIYLEGNRAIWQLLEQDPTWVEKFSLGKYDPANQEHVAILRDLGML
jgi:hypothetical protein